MNNKKEEYFYSIYQEIKARSINKKDCYLGFLISTINTCLYPEVRYESLLFLIQKFGDNKLLKIDRRSMISINPNNKIITYHIDLIPFIDFTPKGLIKILNIDGLIKKPTTSNNYHNKRLYDLLNINLGYYKVYNNLMYPSFLIPDKHGIIFTPFYVLEYNYFEAKFKLNKYQSRSNFRSYLTLNTEYSYDPKLNGLLTNSHEANWAKLANQAQISLELNKILKELMLSTSTVSKHKTVIVKIKLDTFEVRVYKERECLSLQRLIEPKIKELFTKAGLVSNNFGVLNIKLDFSDHSSIDLLQIASK